MAYIKTLKDNELVGGTDITDVYPISSTQAIYRQDSEGLAPENVPQLLEESLQDIEQKLLTLSQYATKVSGATANNFAALDANGNLKDSGKSTDDFIPKNPSSISVTDSGGKMEFQPDTIATSYNDITFATGITSQTPQETTLSSLKDKYTKPSTGIPKTDLASAVQASLNKADTALQAADINGSLSVASGGHIEILGGYLSVSGDAILGHTGSLRIKNSDGSQQRQVIGITDNRSLDIGWGTATQDNIATRIWGSTNFVNTSGSTICAVETDGLYFSSGHQLRFVGNEGDPYIWCEDDTDNLVIDGVMGEVRVYADIEASAFIDGSDSRLKDIKGNVELTAEQIASLPAVKFTWKKDAEKEDRKEQVGTIAQEVQKILPEVVSENKDGMLGMQYGQAAMVSVINLARTVVEQQQTIEALTKRLEALEKKIQ